MVKKIDLTGQKFNKLLVLRETPKEERKGTRVTWVCQCECGATTKATSDALKRGEKKSCGSCKATPDIDLSGQRFNMLVVKPNSYCSLHGLKCAWTCVCDCGMETRFTSEDLTSGEAISCGCHVNRIEDLTGTRFGMLLVISEVPKEQRTFSNRINWDCLCDCGNHIVVTTYRLKHKNKTDCGCVNNLRLAGRKFGKLTAIQPLDDREYRQVLWDCVCECGGHTKVRAYQLTAGKVKSCGCLISPDLIGNTYGMLTVIEKLPYMTGKQMTWRCRCDCGGYKDVPTGSLTSKNTQSCGCMGSRGEAAIREYLRGKSIKFEAEYTFRELYHLDSSRPLRFDFAIVRPDNCVALLVEYDGKQHFEPCELFGGAQGFSEVQLRDEIKNSYCKDNSIPLLRIPYTAFESISSILDEELQKYI